MKQADHKALSLYLLEHFGDPAFWGDAQKKRAFLTGSVIPDFNPLTYLRGISKSGKMLGHNSLYSEPHIRRTIKKFSESGVRSISDCFFLGTLIHYVADSFTHPHTPAFEGGKGMHRTYENQLHAAFEKYLSEISANPPTPETKKNDLNAFLYEVREAYEKNSPSCEEDCRRIVWACTGIFSGLTEKKKK